MPDMVAIAVRLGLYLDLMLLFGLPMFGTPPVWTALPGTGDRLT